MTVKQFNVIKEILYLFLFNNLIPQKYKVISYIVYRMIYSQTVQASPIMHILEVEKGDGFLSLYLYDA